MAVRIISTFTPIDLEAAIKAVDPSATTYFIDSKNLIFGSSCFDGVVRYYLNGYNSSSFYWGTSWVSGANIANEGVIEYNNASSGAYPNQIGVCCVPGKILAFNVLYNTNTKSYSAIIGKLTTGDTYTIGVDASSYNTVNVTGFVNRTTGVTSGIVNYIFKPFTTLLTPEGNYFKYDIKRVENNIVVEDNLQNIKILCKAFNIVEVAQIWGNHVTISGGGACSYEDYMPYDFLIIDGAL